MKIYHLTQNLCSLEDEPNLVDLVDRGDRDPTYGGDPADIVYIQYWKGYRHNLAADYLKLLEDELYSKIKAIMPDVVYYNATWNDPSDDFFFKVKSLNIPILITMPDSMINPSLTEIKLFHYADYLIVYDSIINYFRFKIIRETSQRKSHIVFAGGHQFDSSYYKNLNIPKIYDVSMLGSVEGVRSKMIKYFKHHLPLHGITFHHTGGIISYGDNQTTLSGNLPKDFLSSEDYLKKINQTKINIVSQTVSERMQIKCKIFEYLSCGAFCLVDKNIEYELLIPHGVVVYYSSLEDCLSKIRYYLKHEKQRELIAEKGQKWFKENFNSKVFWRGIYKSIENKSALPMLPAIHSIQKKLEPQLHQEVFGNIRSFIFTKLKLPKEKNRNYFHKMKIKIKNSIPKKIKVIIKKCLRKHE